MKELGSPVAFTSTSALPWIYSFGPLSTTLVMTAVASAPILAAHGGDMLGDVYAGISGSAYSELALMDVLRNE